MRVYIDTSAFLAVMNASDEFHVQAKEIWYRLLEEKTEFVVNSFVLLETHVLIQNRLGLNALKSFANHIYPLLTVEWVEQENYEKSITSLLLAGRKSLSLTDVSSFNTMKQLKIDLAFSFDKHFKDQGFSILEK